MRTRRVRVDGELRPRESRLQEVAPPPPENYAGHQSCVSGLTHLLERAQRGEFVDYAFVAIIDPCHPSGDTGGGFTRVLSSVPEQVDTRERFDRLDQACNFLKTMLRKKPLRRRG